ncbi:Mrp/NBP35 family ATP-binding protein [Gemmatimonas sp.]|uniref:Mrp/NBP35 family ATP-binding protein n=4 Tax=Gemmatimonas sp. TaxID=1962908 RepID=UPI0025C079B6|nr:Mrp/NBP35 family ATP-binding protein [Gemmatimonas sp.]MCA2983105.1 Mrp/NBP35 family ATP-binding protein [Gemmatimonas sp.]MCA2987754.1 Mrp/NBP35 family ATP-binding protein [Gemmatimonas sp.]MCA2990178.1 Mrp/NBP35 family ATP-binding protein [Gemmatimonas sp.]MCA2995334.1 Mrp/NBP35 family ATP-binding protein [Gemmatimonas sp.]MCE2955135.1 Mrp/NBP35 family ATP-binding protein [Gemmatimonas sp.]
MQPLMERITGALAAVRNPRTGADVMAAEQVRDIATTRDGKVRLTLLLAPEDDATLVRDVRQAIEALEGVSDVRVDVRDPAQSDPTPARRAPATPAPNMNQPKAPAAGGMGRALPVMDATPQKAPPKVPDPVQYPNLGRIIAISSGKGGVGKSTVAVNLAISLAKAGKRVGIMDADIYGPNMPLMLGVDAAPAVRDEKIIPLEAHGIKVISLGFLIEKDQPAIWRGPIVMKIITQFLRDVNWGQLDYFLVDMPPGTGDAQLSLVQATQVHGAVVVTTPQQVAVGDALRGVKMFERTAVPVLGIVENMSYFENPETGKPIALFGSGGGERLAAECDLPLLGQVPIDPRIQEGGDTGRPIVSAEPESKAAKAFSAIADRVMQRVAERYG